MAFWEQVRMEWRIQRRRPLVWFCFVAFFLLALSDTAGGGWEARGNTWINGAAMILNRAVIYTLLGIPAVAAIMSEPMVRDRSTGVDSLVLTTVVSRATLTIARFLVSFAIVIAATSMFIPGMIVGAYASGIPPELIGPWIPMHYAKAMFYFLIPNFLIVSALIFVVASFSQNRTLAFGTGIAAVALWRTVRMMLGRDVFRHEVFNTYALADPFGTIASSEFMMSRTVAQNNLDFAPMAGTLLWNRILWLGTAAALLLIATLLLPMRPRLARIKRRSIKPVRLSNSVQTTATSQSASRADSAFGWFAVFLSMTRWELMGLWRQPAIKVGLAVVALTLWWAAGSAVTNQFSLPSTDLLVHGTNYSFNAILVLAIVWIAGELLWRDQMLRTNELIDSQPTSDTARFSAKTITLLIAVLVIWSLSIAVNMTYQLTHGYYRLEPRLYLTDSFIFKAPFYLWLAVLAIAVQAVIRKRYIAIGVVLLIYSAEFLLDAIDWYHPMFRYGRVSHFWYSLMDGYGHFWKAHLWMLLYWSLAAIIIWIIGWACLWRGTNPPSQTWYARHRLCTPRAIAALVASLGLFFITGGWIWYQSAVQGTWPPLDEDLIHANIERAYGEKWRGVVQPRIVGIKGELDLYPSQRRFKLQGEYTLENQSDQAISELLIPIFPGVSLDSVDFNTDAARVTDDPNLNIQVWKLASPMQPHSQMTMKFQTSKSPPVGFDVHAANDNIPEVLPVEMVGNGTSLLNLQMMPAIGYTDRVEHKPAWKRRRYGLPEHWEPPSGPLAQIQGHATLHLGWVRSHEMIIRTDADQTALYGGDLVDDWTEPDGRRGFRYRMDFPSRGWSSVMSARYLTRRFTRNGLPDVEIYYDAQHESNVEPFAKALHDAMEYYAKHYGPPPFKVFRLGEQSLHYDGRGQRAGLAYSSEILGWKADLTLGGDEELRYMAALMISMAWWDDQLIPANVAGAKIIHSGLAFWTAAMYLHSVRPAEIDRQLRLQAMMESFRGRGEMTDEEAPFALEFKDSTVLRNKGSLAILYLSHLLGPEKLESILAEFLDQWRFRGPPYPTPQDFLSHLRSHVPSEYHTQIADIFETVTVWRCRVTDIQCEQLPNSKWKLTATIDARKYRTSGWGQETEVPFETPVQLVAFKDFGFGPQSIQWSEDRVLQSGVQTITIELSEKPRNFGVDPFLFLPDPNPHDNLIMIR